MPGAAPDQRINYINFRRLLRIYYAKANAIKGSCDPYEFYDIHQMFLFLQSKLESLVTANYIKNEDEIGCYRSQIDQSLLIFSSASPQDKIISFPTIGELRRRVACKKLQENALRVELEDTNVEEIKEEEKEIPPVVDIKAPENNTPLTPSRIRMLLGLEMNETNTDNQEGIDLQEKEQLEEEMISMVKRLKESTHSMRDNLDEDSQILNDVVNKANSNLNKVAVQSTRLTDQLHSSLGLVQILFLIFLMIGIFVFMYILIRFFPKK